MKSKLFIRILDSVMSQDPFANYIYLYHQNFHNEKTRVRIFLKNFEGYSDKGDFYKLNVPDCKLINTTTNKRYEPQFFKDLSFCEEAHYANEAMSIINSKYSLADGIILPYIFNKKNSPDKKDKLFIDKEDNAVYIFCPRTLYALLTHLGINKKRLKLKHIFQKKGAI